MKLVLQLNYLPGETGSWKKDFFTTVTSNLQATTQKFQDTSSEVIASSVTNWLQSHPAVFRIFNTIVWATDHAVISFVFIILTIAIAFSIVKALNRLLERVGLSILQAPFKLIRTGFKFSPLSSLSIQQKLNNKNISSLALNDVSTIISQNPQQRLSEISDRLQVLQKEHNELLQEAATILTLNKS